MISYQFSSVTQSRLSVTPQTCSSPGFCLFPSDVSLYSLGLLLLLQVAVFPFLWLIFHCICTYHIFLSQSFLGICQGWKGSRFHCVKVLVADALCSLPPLCCKDGPFSSWAAVFLLEEFHPQGAWSFSFPLFPCRIGLAPLLKDIATVTWREHSSLSLLHGPTHGVPQVSFLCHLSFLRDWVTLNAFT